MHAPESVPKPGWTESAGCKPKVQTSSGDFFNVQRIPQPPFYPAGFAVEIELDLTTPNFQLPNMSSLGYAEAFARYGAKLKNVQWSVCAMTPDGNLVVSLWQHHFRPPKDGTVKASGRFDRWKGPGNTEFRERVMAAFQANTPVKVVISHTDQPDEVERGADASYLKNTFSVREDWIGSVSRINGEDYEFEFRRAK